MQQVNFQGGQSLHQSGEPTLWENIVVVGSAEFYRDFLNIEKCCKQETLSRGNYLYCGHGMINGRGPPIPGHEYLTFYQMMLRISPADLNTD